MTVAKLGITGTSQTFYLEETSNLAFSQAPGRALLSTSSVSQKSLDCKYNIHKLLYISENN